MITMTLNGEGEPQPTLMQAATQAVMVELFTQWQTYRNGVHMDWDTFRSVNFRALAVAALTGAGFSVTAAEATLQLPKLSDADLTHPERPDLDPHLEAVKDTHNRRAALIQDVMNELDGKNAVPPEVTLAGTTTRRSPGVTKVTEEWGAAVDYPQPGSEAWDEHMRQVQG